jgi:DNA-binding beta-propeller fold protein YncE
MDDDAWFELNDLQVRYDTLLTNAIAKQAGLFVINEGNFMYDNASLSYYLIDSMNVLNEVFSRTNDVPLGDVALSMNIRDSLGYIVINNSSKIYVINTNTFEYRGKITGLVSPRYIHFVNDRKAYVSDLYARAVSIVDLQNNEVTGIIDVDNGRREYNQHPTEQFIPFGEVVFTNCWSFDNQLLVIDTRTDRIADSIEVLRQPNSMVMDRFDRLWVLCDGGIEGSPYGREVPGLVRINAATRAIERTIYFNPDDVPSELVINGTGDTLYFINHGIYRQPVASTGEPEAIINSSSEGMSPGGFYGLGIDPYTGEIYVADAIDFVRQGRVYRYSPTGLPVDTFKTGIVPGAFCFKPSF